MPDSEKENIEKRKEKLAKWLKEPSNLLLIGILIFSLVVLIYYFNLTKTQTLWWDEAEYMSTAKHWAFGVPYVINPQRPPIFPFFAFLIYKIGLGDLTIKFLLSVLPLWLSVIAMYLFIRLLYNKKIALLAAFILSVSWIHLFYSMRFMTDSIGFLAGLLAFLFFWKGYMNKGKPWHIWIVGFFVAISFLTRLTGILYGAIIFFFLLFTDRFRFFKNKHIWMIPLVFLLTISPYLLWSYSYYGNALAFQAGYPQMIRETLFATWMFPHVYDYPELVFFILFLVGILTLIPMLLSLDMLILKDDKRYLNDFFILFTIIFTLLFFGIFLNAGGENRWLIMMSIGIFALSAKGIMLIFDFAKKNLGSILAIIVLLALVSGGAYYELKHADMIIKNKIPSYSEVQSSALWIKENSPPTDSVITLSTTEMTFYTERMVYAYNNFNLSELKKIIQEKKPAFFTFSPVYETQNLRPDVLPWIQENSKNQNSFLVPVYATFADAQKTQATFVVFRINYAANQSALSEK